MGLFNSRYKQSQDSLQNPQTPASRFGVDADSDSSINMSQSGIDARGSDLSALKRTVSEEYGEFTPVTRAQELQEFPSTEGSGLFGNIVTGVFLGTDLTSFIPDPNQLWKGAGFLVLGVLGLQAARVTLRRHYIRVDRQPMKALKKFIRGPSKRIEVILPPNLEERLSSVVSVTKTRQKDGEKPLRILMQGPRNTGKFTTAKKMAQDLEKDWGLITFESLTQGGEENAAENVEHAFRWAACPWRNFLLFFEDADRFLKPKSSEHTSEHLRDLQDAFLLQSREHSKRVMVILGTKSKKPFLPEDYHVDEVMEFQMPGLEERKRFLQLYLRDFVLHMTKDEKSFDARVLNDDALYLEMAKMTDGMNGSDLWGVSIVVGFSALEGGDFRGSAIKKCQKIMENRQKLIQRMIEKKKQESKSSNTGADDSEDSELENPPFIPVIVIDCGS